MSSLAVETDRLRLVPFTQDLLDALDEGVPAEALAGAAVPAGWPDEELAGLLQLYRGWLRDDPSIVGWGPWAVVAREANAVAGSAGFVGAPQGGAVEIGYGIVPAQRNRGFATEAVRALVGWALGHPNVDRVIATCDVSNTASVRVLEKAGFTCVGRDGDSVAWSTATP